jgi:hypothetical protein
MVGILFGRRAMYHQVDHGLLNTSQFGRPGDECQDASISKMLHNLTAMYTHTSMGQFESDPRGARRMGGVPPSKFRGARRMGGVPPSKSRGV